MEEYLYPHFYKIEKEHWWFVARQHILLRYLDARVHPPASARLLDVGCGTGAILELFSQKYDAYGLDFSPSAIEFCRQRGLQHLFAGSIESYPHETLFDIITMLDVVEHADDDLGLLRAGRNLLSDSGALLVTVPAFPSLWGHHDVVLHHRRRYTKAELIHLVEAAGFQIAHITFLNAFLFPAAVAKRALARLLRSGEADDLEIPGHGLNTVLRRVFELEGGILARASLPFGLSLLCLAKKRGD